MYLPNKKRPWLPWLAGFLLIAFLVAFFHFLGGILTPFIIAAVLAYILNPLVSKLEAHGIKRGRASMWVMLFALFLLTALLQFGSWHGLLSVWAVFAVGQFLESFLITPKIVGDKIGLSPFWVIFSLMAFGQLLGFVGMLVALPLAAVCLVLLQEGKQAYVSSSFYRKR